MATASEQMTKQLLDDYEKLKGKIPKIQEHIKNYKENSDEKKDPPSAEHFKTQLANFLTVEKEKITGFKTQYGKSPKIYPEEGAYKDARAKITNIMKYLEMTEKAVEKEKTALAEQIKKRGDTDLIFLKSKCPEFVSGSGTLQKSGDYWGGTANTSHVHIYGGGFHLKLGSDRHNIVQNGKVYRDGATKAYSALKSRSEKDMVANLMTAIREALKPYLK